MSLLEKKIALSFSALSLVFFIVIVITQHKVNELTELSRKIQNIYEPSIQANLRMTNAINASASSLNAWVLYQDEVFVRQRQAAWSVIGKMQNQLLNQSRFWADEEQVNRLQLIMRDLSILQQYQTEVESKSATRERELAVDFLKLKVMPLSSQLNANLRKISDPQYWQMERVFSEEERREEELKNMTLFFLFLSALLSAGLAILISRSVIAPLNRMVKLAGKIANGSYTFNEKHFNPRDKLDKALHSMTVQLLEWRAKNEKQQLELTEYNQELRVANASLARANEELSQFAYRTSHDLKAPLVTVRKLSEIMGEDIKAKQFADIPLCAENIGKHVFKLEKLVEDILHLSKADLYDFEQEQFNLKQLVEGIKLDTENSYRESNVSIEVDINPEIELFLPKARLLQVIGNLLSNGVKYADKGKSASWVRISADVEYNRVKLAIEDNGLGIPESSRGKLFSMFQRFHPEVTTGSGLGLYIVKKHLDNIGAAIDVQFSEQGTAFEILLPYQQN